jgi:hypothetical protein
MPLDIGSVSEWVAMGIVAGVVLAILGAAVRPRR